MFSKNVNHIIINQKCYRNFIKLQQHQQCFMHSKNVDKITSSAAPSTITKADAESTTTGHENQSSATTDSNLLQKKSEFNINELLQNSKLPPTLNNKISKLFNLYEELSRMNDVRKAQDNVILIQNELKCAQENRRMLLHELSQIQLELQKVHNELLNCDKSDKNYLQLINTEYNIIRKLKLKQEQFKSEDDNERNLFAYLTAAVKISHEKEKIYADTVKYWSIFASLIGAVIGVIGTFISLHYRKKTITLLIEENKEQMETIKCFMEKFDENLQEIHFEINKILFTSKEHQKQLLRHLQRFDEQQQQQQQQQSSIFSYMYKRINGMYRWCWPKSI